MARPIDGTWNSFLLNLSYLTLRDFQENKAGLNTLKTAVESQPTLTLPNEWVSVEDELPKNNTQVLMWSARWKIAEAGSYYNQHFWVYSEIGDGYIADNITHWMYLPAPPAKEDECK